MYRQPRPYRQEEYKTGPLNLLALEKSLIIKAMSKSKGDVKAAAELLGILPITLERKMPRHHIKREYFIEEELLLIAKKQSENGDTSN